MQHKKDAIMHGSSISSYVDDLKRLSVGFISAEEHKRRIEEIWGEYERRIEEMEKRRCVEAQSARAG